MGVCLFVGSVCFFLCRLCCLDLPFLLLSLPLLLTSPPPFFLFLLFSRMSCSCCLCATAAVDVPPQALPRGRVIRLRSFKTGKNVRLHGDGRVDALGGEGELH